MIEVVFKKPIFVEISHYYIDSALFNSYFLFMLGGIFSRAIAKTRAVEVKNIDLQHEPRRNDKGQN